MRHVKLSRKDWGRSEELGRLNHRSRGDDLDDQSLSLRETVVVLLLPTATFALIFGVIWLFFNFGIEGYQITRTYNIFIWQSIHSVTLWIVLAFWLVFATAVVATSAMGRRLFHGLTLLFATALVVVTAWPMATTFWDNDKDLGRYYANSTVFYVSDPQQVPDSLKRLAEGAPSGVNCELLGSHDVHGCIKAGELDKAGWEPRVSSFEGAKNAIRRKTEGVQRVSLNESTVTYLNADNQSAAMWSGVLDGTGREQPLYGVSEWDGSETNPTVCLFEGDYAIKRAFGGQRGNSLPNLLADRYPDMRWSIDDVWGYCDGDEPIIVVPMSKPMAWMNRTVDTAAGIVVIRGNNGDIDLTHVSDVKAGVYRGPVYPASLVAMQRDETKWAAGRKNMDRFGFGYESSDAEVQSGNSSEYVLRDVATGRIMYVTPLTLSSSTSEMFVAYAVSYADEVTAGQLNQLSVYVLDQNDPRIVNIDKLAADANTWMSQNAGMFRSNGGSLIEFTPVNGDTWRVFGEMGGQVVYRLDISASNKIQPTLVRVGTFGASETPTSNGDLPLSQCIEDVSSLSNEALASCLDSVTSEVYQRLGEN